jgi:hypothetical protein
VLRGSVDPVDAQAGPVVVVTIVDVVATALLEVVAAALEVVLAEACVVVVVAAEWFLPLLHAPSPKTRHASGTTSRRMRASCHRRQPFPGHMYDPGSHHLEEGPRWEHWPTTT